MQILLKGTQMQQDHQYFSQYGEDRLLYELFNKRETGFCIEVGGFDGITGSTTLFFERMGWKCLIVEPMPEFCEKIRQVRNCEVVQAAASDESGEATFHVAEGVETLSTLEKNKSHASRVQWEGGQMKEIKVKKLTPDEILSNSNVKEIDFISIDVEGHEMSVLKGLSLQIHQPRIILIEDNSHGLDRKVKKYLAKFGYSKFKITGCNDWYAKKNDKNLVSPIRIVLTEFKTIFKIIEMVIKTPIIWLLSKEKIEYLVKLIKKPT